MNAEKKIKFIIKDVIGSNSAVSTEEGTKVFQQIDKALKANASIQISFIDISLITTAFLNAAIGQLYGSYDGTFLNQKLEIQDIEATDLEILKKVIKAAKQYFENQVKVNQSLNKVLDEDN